ncbi:hypothetical protein [Halomarina oriensis]|nr:hypothetical protein [Halomarina oriensis]
MATSQHDHGGQRSCPHCGTQPMHVLAREGDCRCLDCGRPLN